MKTIEWRRLSRASFLFGAVALGVAASGCNSGTEPEEEPEVATMRLVVGSQTINVNARTGVVTGGPIVLAPGATAGVTAQFLLADGAPEPLVTDASFRLDATPANTGIVAFSRTGPFAGTLSGVAAGSTTVVFGLFHLEEGHEEFEWPVAVQVAEGP
jgi:hypothetical protein